MERSIPILALAENGSRSLLCQSDISWNEPTRPNPLAQELIVNSEMREKERVIRMRRNDITSEIAGHEMLDIACLV